VKVAILQSNYVPWKGYFDIIRKADRFVFYDEVQYTKNDWRNRNRIKTANGALWLTIPVETRHKFGQKICETRVANDFWRRKHWASIRQAYRYAEYFGEYAPALEELYLGQQETSLSRINFDFIRVLCRALGIETELHWSTEFPGGGGRVERLVEICRALGATVYLSGPSGRNYIESEASKFVEAGIRQEYMRYDYPEYRQLHGPFVHSVSVIDLLFNTGPDARRYMESACEAA
jgi:hypothetical protein